MTGATILLAAGGTGGHFFPAEATARALVARGADVHLVVDRRAEAYARAIPGVTTHRVSAGTLGVGLKTKLVGIGRLAIGLAEAMALVARIKPDAALGFGGYPSLPTMLAARQAGVRIALHEQNAVLGRANRLLAGAGTVIATSFSPCEGIPRTVSRIAMTGNPVRPAIHALHQRPYPELADDEPLHLLVVGGSQGASIFADLIPAALATLPRWQMSRIKLTMQCRAEIAPVAQRLDRLGVAHDLQPFFEDMAERLAAAHLVIARAGASTIAELATAGRPAILVPYPQAMDDHQRANAEALADAGAAWLMPQSACTAEALGERLETLSALPTRLTRAADCARRWARPNAAEALAELALAVAADRAIPDGLEQTARGHTIEEGTA